MNTSNEVICYDYEYSRPWKKSMRYNADRYYKIYKIVSKNWYNYLKRTSKDYSILDIVKDDFPTIPRMVLGDIVNSISISMEL